MPNVDDLRSRFKAYTDNDLRELAAEGQSHFTPEAWDAIQAELTTRSPASVASPENATQPEPTDDREKAPLDQRLGAYVIDLGITLVPLLIVRAIGIGTEIFAATVIWAGFYTLFKDGFPGGQS